jgi:uncharacterized pyridoxamine 5'-phosphate oxidase family protein
METLYFTKSFVKGILKGLTYNESMSFISVDKAVEWVKDINAKKNLKYKVIDSSFQKYWRD